MIVQFLCCHHNVTSLNWCNLEPKTSLLDKNKEFSAMNHNLFTRAKTLKQCIAQAHFNQCVASKGDDCGVT